MRCLWSPFFVVCSFPHSVEHVYLMSFTGLRIESCRFQCREYNQVTSVPGQTNRLEQCKLEMQPILVAVLEKIHKYSVDFARWVVDYRFETALSSFQHWSTL
jgi:hypothetical protein